MTADRTLAGRYRLGDPLARGGMGEVFAGYDERLDRPVAIKMMRRPLPVGAGEGSPEALDLLESQRRDRVRFLREIRTAAQLEHPGTPAVYDTGVETLPGGGEEIWLVMQLLRGSTLEGLLDSAVYGGAESPTIGWAAAIAAQIAAVLADVHRVDVVHRDIKPANIMVVDGGLVKVLDFGIAILRGASALPRLTQVDRTVGTPAYMSPEQHLGRAVTGASDVYSLGCLLYELLTGDPPYRHDGTGAPQRAQHVQAPVPSVRMRRSEIPEDVNALVTGMLAKVPTARPSAEEVYRALTPYLTGEGEGDRDPLRPFHTPLLAPPRSREPRRSGPMLTDETYDALIGNVRALQGAGQATAANRLMEDALERAPGRSPVGIDLRYKLGVALFNEGEFRKAAGLLTAAGDGFRERLGPTDSHALECAYFAGHAYAEIDDPVAALVQLQFHLHHAPDSTDLETRFLIAQLLAVEGHVDDAAAQLRALRPAFVAEHGERSMYVTNLDRQLARLS